MVRTVIGKDKAAVAPTRHLPFRAGQLGPVGEIGVFVATVRTRAILYLISALS